MSVSLDNVSSMKTGNTPVLFTTVNPAETPIQQMRGFMNKWWNKPAPAFKRCVFYCVSIPGRPEKVRHMVIMKADKCQGLLENRLTTG